MIGNNVFTKLQTCLTLLVVISALMTLRVKVLSKPAYVCAPRQMLIPFLACKRLSKHSQSAPLSDQSRNCYMCYQTTELRNICVLCIYIYYKILSFKYIWDSGFKILWSITRHIKYSPLFFRVLFSDRILFTNSDLSVLYHYHF